MESLYTLLQVRALIVIILFSLFVNDHFFLGIGGGNVTLQKGIELASRAAAARNWRRCKYLIIDEISMIDGDYFEVCKILISYYLYLQYSHSMIVSAC